MIVFTGATGSLGRWLAPELDRAGLASAPLRARLHDREGLREELGRHRAAGDAVLLHLAAMVSVPGCERDPELAFQTNVSFARTAVEDFLDWAQQQGVPGRVLLVGTGHVYAELAEPGRLREDSPVGPRSVYARTKLQAEEAIQSLCRARGAPAATARVFGLLSPGQPENYLLPGLLRRVRGGQVEGIPGLDAARDYLDARDACRDLVELSRLPAPPPVVNVCSGKGVRIRAVLAEVARALSREVRPTAAPGRPDDIPWLVGDPGLLERLLGPRPRRPLEETVADALAFA